MKNYPACNSWYTVTNLSHNWSILLASIRSQQNWPIHFEELKLQHLTQKQLFTCVWQQLPPMFLKHLSVSPSKVQFRTTYTLGIPLNMTFSFDTLGVVFLIVAKQDSLSDRLFQHIFNPSFLHVGVTKNNFILTMLILSKRWLELRKMLTGHIVWFKTSFLKPKLCEMYRRLFGELIFWSWKNIRAEIYGYVLFRVGVHLPLELLNWLLLLHNK